MVGEFWKGNKGMSFFFFVEKSIGGIGSYCRDILKRLKGSSKREANLVI
jgi:hypothetical protein